MNQANWERLAQYLDERAEKDDWCLPAIPSHGFLCASVAGPDQPLWLTQLTEGHAAQLPPWVVESLHVVRQDIQNTLASDEVLVLPFEVDEAEVDSELGDWCIGFMDCLLSNDELWYAKPEDEATIMQLTLPMAVFSGIEEDDPDMQKLRRDGNQMDSMAEAIPELLTDLYLHYHALAE